MRVSYRETALIADNLAALIGAGVNSERTFALLQKYRSKRAHRALAIVHDTVRQGLPYSEGFRRSASAWPPYFVEMIRCAEMAGQLHAGFQEGARHFKQMAQTRRTIFKLWFNPTAIIAAGIVAATALYAIFLGLLPACGYFFAQIRGPLMFAGVIVGVLYIPPLRRILDRAVVHIPFLAELARDLACYQFTTCFYYLYIGAVRAPEMVRLAAGAVGNSYLAEQLSQAAEKVEHGAKFAEALAPAMAWPPEFMSQLETAEASGQLQYVLHKLAQERREALEARVNTARRVIEPLVTYFVLIALAFAIVAIAGAMGRGMAAHAFLTRGR